MIESSILIGGVSIRQLRVKDKPCDVPYQKLVNPSCRYGYDAGNRDEEPLAKANLSWYHGDSYLTRSADVTGKHARYDGGGYQVILPNKRYRFDSGDNVCVSVRVVRRSDE